MSWPFRSLPPATTPPAGCLAQDLAEEGILIGKPPLPSSMQRYRGEMKGTNDKAMSETCLAKPAQGN